MITLHSKIKIWLPNIKKMTHSLLFKDMITAMSSDGGIPSDAIPLIDTGAKDKNGVELYDRDIVFTQGIKKFYIQVIEFHNTEGNHEQGWLRRNLFEADDRKQPLCRIEKTTYFYLSSKYCERMGNFFEMPELQLLHEQLES